MKKNDPFFGWNNCNICRQCNLKAETEVHGETWLSKHFNCFKTKLNKSGKVKILGSISRNIETMGLYREIIETDWNMKKLAKSKCFILKCFETKLKQNLEKVKIPGPISDVLKHWNNRLYREIIETDWNMKKIT